MNIFFGQIPRYIRIGAYRLQFSLHLSHLFRLELPEITLRILHTRAFDIKYAETNISRNSKIFINNIYHYN